MQAIRVRVMFGHTVQKSRGHFVDSEVEIDPNEENTVLGLKQKIAAKFGYKLSPDQLLLYFGPNHRHIGKQYVGDPAADEASLKLSDYSVLPWLRRFPHWHIGVRLLPPTPPPPGVATHRAAALAEGKDPDRAIRDARSKGEIPKILELPAPWGPKPFVPPTGDKTYLPVHYPPTSMPTLDVCC